LPIYVYKCDKCSNQFELKQGFDAESTQPCPECTGIGKRQFYSPAVIYKGSGWYTTDYARKSVNPAGPVESKNDDSSKSADSENTKETVTKKSSTETDTKSSTETDTKSS